MLLAENSIVVNVVTYSGNIRVTGILIGIVVLNGLLEMWFVRVLAPPQ